MISNLVQSRKGYDVDNEPLTDEEMPEDGDDNDDTAVELGM